MASDRVRRDSQKKIVILDTNAILMLFEFSVDLHAELRRLLGSYQLVIPTSVVQELKHISQQGDGLKNRNAKAGLTLIKDIEQIEIHDLKGDEAVFSLAKQLQGIVVTNDRNLRLRLKEQSLPVIFLRKKQMLSME